MHARCLLQRASRCKLPFQICIAVAQRLPSCCGMQVPVVAENGPEAYTSVRFHPDGLILGTTTEKKVVR